MSYNIHIKHDDFIEEDIKEIRTKLIVMIGDMGLIQLLLNCYSQV